MIVSWISEYHAATLFPYAVPPRQWEYNTIGPFSGSRLWPLNEWFPRSFAFCKVCSVRLLCPAHGFVVPFVSEVVIWQQRALYTIHKEKCINMVHSKECEIIFLGQRHFISKTLSIRQIHTFKSLVHGLYSLSLLLDSKTIQNKIKWNRPILICILQKYKKTAYFAEFF